MPHRDPAGLAEGAPRRAPAGHAVRPKAPLPAPAAVVRTAVVTDSAAALPADWVRACPPTGG